MRAGRFFAMVLVVCWFGVITPFTVGAQDWQTYTVQSGDTLWGLAQRFYGDQNLWPKLWEMNKFNTANPNRISVGDVLVIHPIDTLMRSEAPPSPPPDVDPNLYDRGQPLTTAFPKHFNFIADPSGIGGTGINRIKVKKIDPTTGKLIETYTEIREVGEIISTADRAYSWEPVGAVPGRVLIAFNDKVMVRFTEDVAKILDSATHEDPDPYFREWPIYGYGMSVPEADPSRADYANIVGKIHEYKGNLTIVARIETLAPDYIENVEDRARLMRRGVAPIPLRGNNQDAEPVSYVAKITYSTQPINIGDRIFLFREIYPGPDREIGSPKLHEANQYVPLAK